MATPSPAPAAPAEADPVAPASLAHLVEQLVGDARSLVQAEIALAKAEAATRLKQLAAGLALLLIGVVILAYGTIWLFAALPERFGATLLGDTWKGYAVFGGLFVVVAVLFALWGGVRVARTVRAIKHPETVQSVKENVAWLKSLRTRNNASK